MNRIEFWDDFASTYSYLSVMRIEAAAQVRVTVLWRPFLLGPIFRSLGWDNSPFLLQPAKGAYMWQDMARQCRKYGISWKQPTTFPRNSLLAARVALTGPDQSWVPAFSRAVMQRNFAGDEDIGSPACIAAILAELGLPAASMLEQAGTEPVKSALRAQTEEAQRRGIFGAPTFFVGSEMFWGNDRLEDALECAETPP